MSPPRALAKMNMVLHDCPKAEIMRVRTRFLRRNSATSDGSLKTFDFVVANPPFSDKAWSNRHRSGRMTITAALSTARRPRRMAITPISCT